MLQQHCRLLLTGLQSWTRTAEILPAQWLHFTCKMCALICLPRCHVMKAKGTMQAMVFCLVRNGEVVKAGIKLKFISGEIFQCWIESCLTVWSASFMILLYLSRPTQLMKTWNALEGLTWRRMAAEPQESPQALHPSGHSFPNSPGLQWWAVTFALECFYVAVLKLWRGFPPSVPSS